MNSGRQLILFSLLSIFSVTILSAQEKITLSGYIKNEADGEAMIGATVFVEELSTGTSANIYGFYSITLPPGTYTIQYRYVSFSTQVKTVELTEGQRLDIELVTESKQLDEIVVTSEALDANVSDVEMSVEKLDIKTIEKIPAFLGEVDVLKSIQLLPGVSSVGEGSSGFNVRGGSVGQNLVLLDDAPVYNSSHLFGFFSVFNPDAVKDIKLIKGGIPANYGGRLSSILDVRMKEGNSKERSISGGIGTVFSRLAVQGPLKKDKSSFFVAVRRSYIDILAKPFTNDATLFFYDLTTKVNYDFNDNNKLYLSGYFGRDVFRFDERQGFDWGNVTGTLRWNHLFNDRLFSNFAFIVSSFDYGFSFGENDLDKFDWNSRIVTYTFKPYFNYFLNTNNELLIGGEATYYKFRPAEAVGVSDGQVSDISLDNKFALESAVYVDNTQKLSDKITLRYGLRFSTFQYMGPGNVYEFQPTSPGERKELIAANQVNGRESIKTYYNLEPRASLRYKIGNGSVKASYTRTAQYIHLVSNTAAPTPIDLWTPSTNNVEPQLGDQYALGYFRNFGGGNSFETSIEGYYRDNKKQVEYVRGADIFINEYLEGDLINGDGRAYGVEFSIKKNVGNLNGWISYTLGRSELKTDGINNNEWYPTRYDQTHNLKLFGEYQITKRTSLSANFTYITGAPITAPTSRFTIQGVTIPYDYFNQRNNLRIPATHRLDIGLKWLPGKPGKERRVNDYFVFSVYNIYGNKNPFSIFFSQDQGRVIMGDQVNTLANQFSIIGAPVPAISYNFVF
ncbi:TonB-dependent receptor [Fulvivirga lutimaris]|uniref:TonB-dependent receptor n=1 Tax=Fulvivirga lutimaris TaxID=1819566 RepID=UPI0012BBF8CF|nr:TonB-dependent receptor [Fulvivirga lutimaris]MTI40655.1 TonB-dependent receptor [Fulvivirga lutimaris]